MLVFWTLLACTPQQPIAVDSAAPGDTPPSAPVECGPIASAEGSTGGVQACSDGTFRRVSAEACDDVMPYRSCDVSGTTTGYGGPTCTEDADCTDMGRGVGRCVAYGPYDWYASCSCIYTCVSDADCEDFEMCLCGDVLPNGVRWNTCVPATCATDADCPSDFCRVGAWSGGEGCLPERRAACASEHDRCTDASQCDDPEADCAYSGGAWWCKSHPDGTFCE